VVELSSFQLQTAHLSAHAAALTNVTPNHLNWHTDMEEYVRAKTNVYRHFPNRRLVTNAENAITRDLAASYVGELTLFSSKKHSYEEFCLPANGLAVYVAKNGTVVLDDGEHAESILRPEDILLPGVHNLENYMTAIALTAPYVSWESVLEVARSFPGVAHRLERIRVLDGVTYYNSSIDSSPTRTAAALSALATLSVHPIVICGGYDKNLPCEPLAEALCTHAKAVVLTGQNAPKIRAALDACERVRDGGLPVYGESDFACAVHLARELAKSGDTVLLSPAAASFDAFKNFAERGDTFRRIVCSF
jgi:UDP-N-acetylmuramoylalanine--D-glutamate ligase